MILKNVFIAVLCTTLLAWSGLSIADEYRPDEFLGLDLSKAVLSPKRLGPASEFAPVAVEAQPIPEARAPRRAWNQRPMPKSVVRMPPSQNDAGAYARGETARRGSHQARAAPRQSARCAGARYPDSGLAVQVRWHLRLAEAEELNGS